MALFSDAQRAVFDARPSRSLPLLVECRNFDDTELVTRAMHLNGTILFQEFELNQIHSLDGAQSLE